MIIHNEYNDAKTVISDESDADDLYDCNDDNDNIVMAQVRDDRHDDPGPSRVQSLRHASARVSVTLRDNQHWPLM